MPLRRRSGGRDESRRHAAFRRAPGDPDRPGRQIRRRRRGPQGAGREARHSGCVVGERHRRHRFIASARARPRRPQRALSGQPRSPAGRRSARVGRALRRPHLQLMASRLFVHDPAHAAHPRGHRPGRDRPQLSCGARPDGRCAHVPAPDSRRTRCAQGRRRQGGGSRQMARYHRGLSQGVGGLHRSGFRGRRLAHQPAARRLRD